MLVLREFDEQTETCGTNGQTFPDLDAARAYFGDEQVVPVNHLTFLVLDQETREVAFVLTEEARFPCVKLAAAG